MRESGGDLCARIHNGGISVVRVNACTLRFPIRICKAGEVLQAREGIQRDPGEILQLEPEADAAVATAP
jgi:hypothetical protein